MKGLCCEFVFICDNAMRIPPVLNMDKHFETACNSPRCIIHVQQLEKIHWFPSIPLHLLQCKKKGDKFTCLLGYPYQQTNEEVFFPRGFLKAVCLMTGDSNRHFSISPLSAALLVIISKSLIIYALWVRSIAIALITAIWACISALHFFISLLA